MLKRQRASSPQPAVPSFPQDIPAEDLINMRDLKRRRVLPPSLDGQARGWNDTSNQSYTDEENEEEYSEFDAQDGAHESGKAAQPPSNVEYESVNSVLKEIHILHKHRQDYAPATHLPPSTLASRCATPYSAPSRGLISEEPPSWQESARIYEHYEEKNRFLALAFLSRRQDGERA